MNTAPPHASVRNVTMSTGRSLMLLALLSARDTGDSIVQADSWRGPHRTSSTDILAIQVPMEDHIYVLV